MCNHVGWALWANHYSWYCANCGYHAVDYRLVPMMNAHQLGEPAGWSIAPDLRGIEGF